jgi:uncharacterized phage-associated protein
MLQKLLYFAHARHLVQSGTPLLSGYFEAWRFGPVHPSVYQSFKKAGESGIFFRAVRTDFITGEHAPIPPPESVATRGLVARMLNTYGALPASRLVELSHAKKGPWHYVVNKGETLLAFGARIPDNVIIDRFKHHKVAVSDQPWPGELFEDPPFA